MDMITYNFFLTSAFCIWTIKKAKLYVGGTSDPITVYFKPLLRVGFSLTDQVFTSKMEGKN